MDVHISHQSHSRRDFFFVPMVAIGVPESHGNINHHTEAGVVGFLFKPFDDLQRFFACLVLVLVQKCLRDGINTSQRLTALVAIARSAPLSFITMPMISTSSGGFSFRSTSSESAICGTAFGETNDTASMCLNPAAIKDFKYCTFIAVGICPASPCQASRGHSINLISSAMLCLYYSHVELRNVWIERRRLQSFGDGVARLNRIDDFVHP